MEHTLLINEFKEGNQRALARVISLVENESPGYEAILTGLHPKKNVPVLGFTGSPGAGKSSLVNALTTYWVKQNKRLAVIAVDPTSPFNFGSLLGDRIRMQEHFNNDHIYIRSMATRGSLGGLCAKIIEVVQVLQAFGFDYILIETVGVGQSEVEIAGIADTSVVVVVPESGDEVQTLKSGVMEIADIFAVNKSDRDGADRMAVNLRKLVHDRSTATQTEVINTTATTGEGIDALAHAIEKHTTLAHNNERRAILLAEKALLLIQQQKTKHFNRRKMEEEIQTLLNQHHFNLYVYVRSKLL
jgi:LAO/AO transport system kinase